MVTLLLLTLAPTQFQVENKATPAFIVQNKAEPQKEPEKPVVVGGAHSLGEVVRVCGPDGCRIAREAVRVNPTPGTQVAPAPVGGYYLGDGQGWWPGKVLGRRLRR